jgi:hypothetical protein
LKSIRTKQKKSHDLGFWRVNLFKTAAAPTAECIRHIRTDKEIFSTLAFNLQPLAGHLDDELALRDIMSQKDWIFKTDLLLNKR